MQGYNHMMIIKNLIKYL